MHRRAFYAYASVYVISYYENKTVLFISLTCNA